MRLISIIFTLFLVIVVAAFAALNAQPVQINYFLNTKLLPLAVVVLIALVVGCLLCALFLGGSILCLRAKNRKLNKAIAQKQKVLTESSGKGPT